MVSYAGIQEAGEPKQVGGYPLQEDREQNFVTSHDS